MQPVIERVEKLVTPILKKNNLQFVGVEISSEDGEVFVRIIIDKQNGIDIEECELVSNQVSLILDKEELPFENYYLEVCSPGAERPLFVPKDYIERIGEYVYLQLHQPIEGTHIVEGQLIEANDESIVVEYRIKTRKKKIAIRYVEIASGRLAVHFS